MAVKFVPFDEVDEVVHEVVRVDLGHAGAHVEALVLHLVPASGLREELDAAVGDVVKSFGAL